MHVLIVRCLISYALKILTLNFLTANFLSGGAFCTYYDYYYRISFLKIPRNNSISNNSSINSVEMVPNQVMSEMVLDGGGT